MSEFERVTIAADLLCARLGTPPHLAMVLGSGFGGLGDYHNATLTVHRKLEFSLVPGFPAVTAPGHRGRFLAATLNELPIWLQSGRVHLYEGYSHSEVVFPVRVLWAAGVRTLILSNAAGAINPAYQPGELVAISDHINLQGNPLIGSSDERFGVRFPDMSCAYDRELRVAAQRAAARAGIALREGVYAGVTGPSFETPAEVRALGRLGADLVGMSTVAEVIAARQLGMRVLAFSLVSNMASGLLDQPITAEEVLERGQAAQEQLRRLLAELAAELPR